VVEGKENKDYLLVNKHEIVQAPGYAGNMFVTNPA
jgi:hypothetical protein